MVKQTRKVWFAVSIAIALAVAPRTALAEDPKQEPAARSSEPEGLGMPNGENLSKFKIDDADPEKSVPTAAQRDGDPLQFGYFLMDLGHKAGVAEKKGDFPLAAKYYAALAKAVPDRSIAFSKACAAYEAIRQYNKAIEYCRAALARPGVTVADSAHFVRLMLVRRTKLEKTEVDDVSEVIENVRREPKNQVLAAELECEFGTKIEDAGKLDRCTADLARAAPGAPKTISYQFALALKKRDYDRAVQLVERAKTSGMGPEGIVRMEQAAESVKPLWRRASANWPVVATVGALFLAIGAAWMTARRRGTLRGAAF